MEPHERLRIAREKAGFEHAKDAALAMSVTVSTYIGHENGSRGIKPDTAARYGRKFKVSPEWILYGTGAEALDNADAQSREIVDIFLRLAPRHRDLVRDLAERLASEDSQRA